MAQNMMNTNSAVSGSNLNPQEHKRIVRILEANWRAEMLGQKTYAAFAERETDPNAAPRAPADAEKRHAHLWAGRLSTLGASQPTYDGPGTGEADSPVNRIGGKDALENWPLTFC